jgi:hypothetical protein
MMITIVLLKIGAKKKKKRFEITSEQLLWQLSFAILIFTINGKMAE